MNKGIDCIATMSIVHHLSNGTFAAERVTIEYPRVLFAISFHQLSDNEEGVEGRAECGHDIRKKVDQAFSRKNVHVTAELESLCCFVHLKCLLGESNGDEQTHYCTEGQLEAIYGVRPNWGN